MTKRNKEEKLEWQRNYHLKNRDNQNKYSREWNKRNKEKMDLYRLKRKQNAMLPYCENGLICCKKCGYTDIRALSIDHINGGGNQQNNKIKNNIYKWLKDNNYPKGFQVLCMNCQWVKRSENKECKGSRIGKKQPSLMEKFGKRFKPDAYKRKYEN